MPPASRPRPRLLSGLQPDSPSHPCPHTHPDRVVAFLAAEQDQALLDQILRLRVVAPSPPGKVFRVGKEWAHQRLERPRVTPLAPSGPELACFCLHAPLCTRSMRVHFRHSAGPELWIAPQRETCVARCVSRTKASGSEDRGGRSRDRHKSRTGRRLGGAGDGSRTHTPCKGN